MLKKGEEGEANRSEMWLLSAEEREERGSTAFCRQACSASSVLSKAGLGTVSPVRDSPYLELLFLQPWIWALLNTEAML